MGLPRNRRCNDLRPLYPLFTLVSREIRPGNLECDNRKIRVDGHIWPEMSLLKNRSHDAPGFAGGSGKTHR